MYALEFDKVSYTYPVYSSKNSASPGGFTLSDISFGIEAGMCVALTGSNGSGKTTLGKLAAGILKPCGGRILVSGKDIARLTLGQIGAMSGYLFQNPERQLFAPTVIEDLIFPQIIGGENEEKARASGREMLALLGLSELENRTVFRLSGGEKLRVALAGILIRKPHILILDEPTNGIDAENLTHLGDIMRELLLEGTAVLLITHNIDFADAYCDSRLSLEKGVLI